METTTDTTVLMKALDAAKHELTETFVNLPTYGFGREKAAINDALEALARVRRLTRYGI